MKHAYDVESLAATTLSEIRAQHVDRSARWPIARSALLVIDMQRFFLDAASHAFVPASPQIIDRVNALAKAFADAQRPVIVTQHINDETNAAQMAHWWRDLLKHDDPLCDIDPRVRVQGSRLVKTQYDAFYRTELTESLNARQITHLVICGVVAELCCETTARSAFVQNWSVTLVADAIASWNADNHRATLRNAAVGFAWPMCTADILAHLESPNE
jgi:isochorismate hydrolase